MKKRLFTLVLAAALVLLCASCTPAAEETPSPTPASEATPTPTPTPEPTPTLPAWETDPGQFIQDCLEEDFAVGGALFLNIFFDASMPRTDVMYDEETGQAIRDLFASYQWECTEGPDDGDYHDVVVGVSAYLGPSYRGVSDISDVPWYFSFSTYHNVLRLCTSDYKTDLYFRAEGAENLCREVAALCPDPDLHVFIVNSPVRETAAATVKQFMSDFFASMTENGHITDYELLESYVLDTDDMIFKVKFRLKPANPEWHLWSDRYDRYALNASNWTKTIEWRFFLKTDGELCQFYV